MPVRCRSKQPLISRRLRVSNKDEFNPHREIHASTWASRTHHEEVSQRSLADIRPEFQTDGEQSLAIAKHRWLRPDERHHRTERYEDGQATVTVAATATIVVTRSRI